MEDSDVAGPRTSDKEYVRRFIAELVGLNGGDRMPGSGTSIQIYGNGAAPPYREADNDPYLPEDPEAAARADYARWGQPVPQREIPEEAVEPTPVDEGAAPPADETETKS